MCASLSVSCGSGGGGSAAVLPPVVTTDSDGDGIADSQDMCPSTPTGETVDVQGCSASQLDTDSDGVANNADSCSMTPAGEAVDSVGCSNSQLDPAQCHGTAPGGGTAPMAPSISEPVVTKLEREGQYFSSGIREFGATATGPDHSQDAITVFDLSLIHI